MTTQSPNHRAHVVAIETEIRKTHELLKRLEQETETFRVHILPNDGLTTPSEFQLMISAFSAIRQNVATAHELFAATNTAAETIIKTGPKGR